MKALYDELSSPLYRNFNINVEGHTDDEPIKTIRYPSNWELSSNRAATVVRFIIAESANDTRMDTNGQKYGVERYRLKATGYADTQPKVPNRDASGNPIKANQIANRRVIIRVNKSSNYNKVKIPKFRRKAKKAAQLENTEINVSKNIDIPIKHIKGTTDSIISNPNEEGIKEFYPVALTNSLKSLTEIGFN